MKTKAKYDIAALQRLIRRYLATLDDVKDDETYTTKRRLSTAELKDFMRWLKKFEQSRSKR